MSTFEDIKQLLESGVSGSLSRIGKNQASRSMRKGGAASDGHSQGGNSAYANVQARTVSRRENTTKGATRSSYLQGIEDNESSSSAHAGGGAIDSSRDGHTATAYHHSLEDDGLRREMCSSPRLHPGIQQERLRDYEAERGANLSRIIYDEGEFAKISLRDEGTTLPGTAPIEQAWTPRGFHEISVNDPAAAKAVSAYSVPEKKKSRSELRELDRQKPGTYFSGRKPAPSKVPGVGYYRPKYEMVEARMTGGYIADPRSAALTSRGQQQQQQQQDEQEQQQKGAALPPLPQFSAPGSGEQQQSAEGGGATGGKTSPSVEHPPRSQSPSQMQQNARDAHSHGLVAARPPFGIGSGFRLDDGTGRKKVAGGMMDAAGASNKMVNNGTGHFAQNFYATGPDAASYWPRLDPKSARSTCYVDMGRDRQDISRNPPAIPFVDITYPAADGIALALKSRTPRAFIAPKKPTDPPAHASTVVGHYAESALVANAVLVAAAGGAGASAPGDRLDLDADNSRDKLSKHNACLVDFKRSARTHRSNMAPTNTTTTDTSNVDYYAHHVINPDALSSAKRALKPVNMDRMIGRPPVVEAPDVRVTELRDELIHPRARETKFAPLQPPSVATRMAKLRAEREGVPRLCGASDVSPIRHRVGTVGAVDFSKGTERKDPTSGSLDLAYDNLDPVNIGTHKRISGDPMLSTRISRTKREQLARPKWGALDKIYDTEAGHNVTLPNYHGAGALYEFDRRVDRRNVFTGVMPSEEHVRRMGAGLPGPGDYAGEIIPPVKGSPGRSFTRSRK